MCILIGFHINSYKKIDEGPLGPLPFLTKPASLSHRARFARRQRGDRRGIDYSLSKALAFGKKKLPKHAGKLPCWKACTKHRCER